MQEFSYKPSFDYTTFIIFMLGIALIYYGITSQFDLAYRRIVILTYPYSKYALIGIGALMTYWGGKDLFYFIAKLGTKGKIRLSDKTIEFPVYKIFKNEQREVVYNDITQLYVKGGDEYSVIIHTKNKERFAFDATFFSSEGKYYQFVEQFEKNYRT